MSTNRKRHQAGFSLVELAMGLTLLAAGFVIVAESLERSQGATQADDAKTRAVREGDRLLRRLSLELAQTTTRVDATLPTGEDQRCWMVANGVRFQKVSGYDNSGGEMTQAWSPMISYVWNPAARQVDRLVAGNPPQVVARGISDFSVTTNPDGQIVVTVESRRGAANRGVQALHRRTVRITPRNELR